MIRVVSISRNNFHQKFKQHIINSSSSRSYFSYHCINTHSSSSYTLLSSSLRYLSSSTTNTNNTTNTNTSNDHYNSVSSNKWRGEEEEFSPVIINNVVGEPIPRDEHACSVALPTWHSIVQYEEGKLSLDCGYPRFVYHAYIRRLMSYCLDEVLSQNHYDCILLPSRDAAQRALTFIHQATSDKKLQGQILSFKEIPEYEFNNNNHHKLQMSGNELNSGLFLLDLGTKSNVCAAVFPAETSYAIAAKSYWQHVGEVCTSRRAVATLDEIGLQYEKVSDANTYGSTVTQDNILKDSARLNITNNLTTDSLYRTSIKQNIANIVSQSPDSVFLSTSGMSAIFLALKVSHAVASSNPNNNELSSSSSVLGKTIVYGFPYLDTLKTCARKEFADSVEFFGRGDERDLESLKIFLESNWQTIQKYNPKTSITKTAGISSLITEFPSNPLLNCHDLESLRELADEYNFTLIVDDTIGNFANLDLLHSGVADMVCTSLTKLYNGMCDAIAGSIIVSEKSRLKTCLKNEIQKIHSEELLYDADARAVALNSIDFLERSTRINETSEALADWFHGHSDVQALYYPKYCSEPQHYIKYMSKNSKNHHKSGYGGLMSIVLEEHMCDRKFYDSLQVSKGPSLGTNFTLVCPYTLLAHYHELEFAREFGVKANLIRIAVGLESFDHLKNVFTNAFETSRLHPKLLK